jgi:SAM-dependent methyltransferase
MQARCGKMPRMSNYFAELANQSDVEIADALLRLQSDIFFAFEREFIVETLGRRGLASDTFEGSILDVGCGNGHHTAKLAELFPRARVVGVDRNPKLLDVARARAARESVRFIQADFLEESSFDGERFDVVNARSVVQYLTPGNADAFFSKAAQVAKPSGLVFAFDTDDAFAVAHPETAYLIAIRNAHTTLGNAALSGDRHVGRKLFHLAGRAGFRDLDFRLFLANSIQHDRGRLLAFLRHLGVFLNRVSPEHFPEAHLGPAYQEFAARWEESGFFLTIPLVAFAGRSPPA